MNAKDIEILRRLGGTYAAICASPANAANRKLITDLNSLRAEQPAVFADPEGAFECAFEQSGRIPLSARTPVKRNDIHPISFLTK